MSIDDEALARLREFIAAAKKPGDVSWALVESDVANWLAEHGGALLDIAEAVARAATGEVVEVGDDDKGQPRVLIHSTRDELRKGTALAFKRVSIVPCTGGE